MKRKAEPDPLPKLLEAFEKLASRGHAKLANQLGQLTALIAQEAAARPSLANKLAKILGEESTRQGIGLKKKPGPRSRRRPPGILDPFEIFKESETNLRRHLENLDVEQLKDIIAEHGMDRDKLAMKWKRPERLIERVIETVRSRTSKGDVFRG